MYIRSLKTTTTHRRYRCGAKLHKKLIGFNKTWQNLKDLTFCNLNFIIKRCTFANKSDRNTTLKTNDKYEKNQTTNIDPIVFDGT